MYYLIGCRAIKLNAEHDFKNKIKKIGIFNPRKNEVYTLEVSKINKDIIKEVETEAIGYKDGIVDPNLELIMKKMKENRK